MEFNEYQKAANRTLYGNEQVLTNCALGLAGESGQLIDLIQDYTFKGKDLDKEKMIDELGDVLWYLSQIAQWADVDFDDVAKANIETLNKRYPNGFTAGMEEACTSSLRCFFIKCSVFEVKKESSLIPFWLFFVFFFRFSLLRLISLFFVLLSLFWFYDCELIKKLFKICLTVYFKTHVITS